MEKEKSQLKIGIILSYINMGLGNIIPIVYMPIMLKILGQGEYGLYKLASSITSYLSLISMGIGSAVTRYLIRANTEKGKNEEENVLGLFMMLFQIIAVVSFVVGCFLTYNLEIWYGSSLTNIELSKMKILVFLLVCNTALSFSISPYISVVNAHEKFIFLQCMNIVSTCLGPILNIVVLCLGYASVGMAISTLFLGIATRFMYLYYVRRIMNIRAKYEKLPIHLLREILSFSFWVFISNIVGQLYNATDTILIGAIPTLGTVGVAVYTVGNTFNNIVFSVTTGISSLLSPKTNKMVFSGVSDSELTNLAIKVGRLQGYIISLVVTGFIAFGKPFIDLYAGDGYEAAYWVAVFMMVPSMIPLVQSACLSIIMAKNKHKFRALVYLGIAIMNVLGTWWILKYRGIIGAALVTGIAVVLGQGMVMNWYYHKKTGLDMFRFWRQVGKVYIVPIGLCAITIILGIYIDFYRIKNMVAGIIGYTLSYCILNWQFVFNDYEKSLINIPLFKAIRKC